MNLTRTAFWRHGSRRYRGRTVTIHDDITGFGALGNGAGRDGLQEYTLSPDGQLSALNASTGHGSSTGGSSLSHGATPLPTLVTTKGANLAIDLVWDASVASAGASE